MEHEQGQTTDEMSWQALGGEPGVKTIIQDNKSTATRAAQLCARGKEAKLREGVWM